MHAPKLSPILGTDKWVLLEDWSWGGFTVPTGFESDLDSIPPIPGIHAWLKGRTKAGALLHDYLYSIRYDRSQADKVFYEAMIAEGVERRHARLIYRAVRMFGWTRYTGLN